MQRNRKSQMLIVDRWLYSVTLLAEWRRRQAQCAAGLAAAKAAGDLERYCAIRRRWDRYYARDPAAQLRSDSGLASE